MSIQTGVYSALVASIRARLLKDGTYVWNVRFSIDGRETSITFPIEGDAKKFRILVDSVGARRAMDAWGIADTPKNAPTGPTVRDWLKEYIAHLTGVEKKTVAEYERYALRDIDAPLGDIPLASLAERDLAIWVNAMKDAGASGKTISNKHGFLSGALKSAVKAGVIPANPCQGMRLPRTAQQEMVCLTHDEYYILYGCFSEYYKPLVDFLVMSGARFSEAAALTPADVNRKTNAVRIWRAWKNIPGGWETGAPKTAKSVRTINVPATVLEPLDYSREWLFLNTAGNPVRIYGWRENVWYPAVRKAQAKGLEKKPRVHDLRHTCASWMIANKIPLPLIQRHLGHESIKTTVDRYGHLDRGDAEEAAVLMGTLLNRSQDSQSPTPR